MCLMLSCITVIAKIVEVLLEGVVIEVMEEVLLVVLLVEVSQF